MANGQAIRTDNVGSILRPPELLEARKEFSEGATQPRRANGRRGPGDPGCPGAAAIHWHGRCHGWRVPSRLLADRDPGCCGGLRLTESASRMEGAGWRTQAGFRSSGGRSAQAERTTLRSRSGLLGGSCSDSLEDHDTQRHAVRRYVIYGWGHHAVLCDPRGSAG